MKKPLITVIVPVYKTRKYVERCVESIRNQTYTNLEIILVDDGSPDDCGLVCDNFSKKDSRIKVIHKENGGLSSARNAGLDIMSGEYVGFVDSDDWIERDMYEILYERMINECADISCCGIKTCDDEKIIGYYCKDLQINFTLERIQALKELTYNNKITCSVVDKLYSVKIFRDLRMREGILYEDAQIQPYCFHYANRITYTSNPLYCYYQSPNSILRGTYSLKHYDIIEIGEERIRFYLQEYPQIKKYAQLYHVSNCLSAYVFSYGIKEWHAKRTMIKQYLKKTRLEKEIFEGETKLRVKYILFRISPKLYCLIMRHYYKANDVYSIK